MSSIKVKLAQTDGSYFISSALNDLPSDFEFLPDQTNFEWGGVNYTVTNYKVNNEDICNWQAGIQLAYLYISLFPAETGYPDLGLEVSLNTDILPYMAIDGSKSMSQIIKALSLSDDTTVDFDLIYSWSEQAASLNTDEFKAFDTALKDAGSEAEDEATQKETECTQEVTNVGTYTWEAVLDSNGNTILEAKICTSTECCSSYKQVWQLAKFQSLAEPIFAGIGVTADDITKKHIYKFTQ